MRENVKGGLEVSGGLSAEPSPADPIPTLPDTPASHGSPAGGIQPADVCGRGPHRVNLKSCFNFQMPTFTKGSDFTLKGRFGGDESDNRIKLHWKGVCACLVPLALAVHLVGLLT